MLTGFLIGFVSSAFEAPLVINWSQEIIDYRDSLIYHRSVGQF